VQLYHWLSDGEVETLSDKALYADADRAPDDFVISLRYGPGTRYRAARDAERRIKELWGDRVKRRMPHCMQRVAFLIRGPRPEAA
jgi:predicted TIM-barrel fold metal-dependent hydrolase